MPIDSMSVSVDGFIADRAGVFDWGTPSDESFRFHLERVSRLGCYLCGRRLYETLLVWETDASLLFDRPRLREIFDFEYVLEQFKPKAQRKYGYFAHPILMGDRFMGMLEAELDRSQEALTVAAVHEFVPFEPEEDEMVRAELADLGRWLGVEVLAW